MKPTVICDTEVYKNYFCIGFLNVETGNVRIFEMCPEQTFDEHGIFDRPIPRLHLDIQTVRTIMRTYRIVTFNGINYDLPIITEALRGATNQQLKNISDKIIQNNIKWWLLGIEPIECDHVDLFNVAPGMASLKIYGGRLHCRRMQDLPIEPSEEISHEQRPLLRQYCANDLLTTLDLFRKLEPQIALREQMGKMYELELRSKSDAQIAEAVIRKEVEKLLYRKLDKLEVKAGEMFRYSPPAWVSFASQQLNDALKVVMSAEFITEGVGTVVMPPELKDLKITIGSSVYRMGIGGLHSSEKSVAHHTDDRNIILDRDVVSYYPAIILNCELRPRHMGAPFSAVYKSLVQKRLAAKKANDSVAADALKITINGSFGKFGSPYSILYSPTLLIQTTITGQLALLMLIEALESRGIPVVSANTDGVVVKCPRDKIVQMELVAMMWEDKTGFVTEETQYRAIYSRDVNNYVAVKDDGNLKLKGAYAPAGLQKNPTNEICIGAVAKHLTDGSPIEESIRNCRDVRKFVTIRQVKGGALKGNQYLGKAVRWYYAKGETGTINYKVNNYTVARTEGAKPLMELPEMLPEDINYEWYIEEANKLLADVGAPKRGWSLVA